MIGYMKIVFISWIRMSRLRFASTTDNNTDSKTLPAVDMKE